MRVHLQQKVKIKNIEPGTIQDGCLFTPGMERYWGEVATVTEINKNHKYIGLFGPTGINNWSWKEDWLEIPEENFLTDKDFEI